MAAYTPLKGVNSAGSDTDNASGDGAKNFVQMPYLTDTQVEIDPYVDYILVFPLQIMPEDHDEESQTQHGSSLTGFSGHPGDSVTLRWMGLAGDNSKWMKRKANPFQSAKKIFLPNCDQITQVFEEGLEKTLEERFDWPMTERTYQDTVREFIVSILVSHKCGFKLSSCPSIDNDEVFLLVKFPDARSDGPRRPRERAKIANRSAPSRENSRTHAKIDFRPAEQQIATQMGLRLPVKPECYEACGEEIQARIQDRDDRYVVAFHPYVVGKEDMFQPFTQVNRMHMCRQRMGHFIDIPELMRQGIVKFEFPPHEWAQVKEFDAEWANIWKFYAPMRWNYEEDDRVREYFGEELAFFFSWATFFTRSMALPMAGAVLVWIAYLIIPEDSERTEAHWVAAGYAVMMAFYGTLVNEFHKRIQHRQVQRWGMRDFIEYEETRPRYDRELDKEWRVAKYKLISSAIMFLFISVHIFLVTGVQMAKWHIIQYARETGWTNGFHNLGLSESDVVRVIMKVGMVVLTVLMLVTDYVWEDIADKLTGWENHRTEGEYAAALVYKLVPVHLFNCLFNFLYIAFAKPVLGRCIPDLDGCIWELRGSVMVFFILRACFTIFVLLWSRKRVSGELAEEVKSVRSRGGTMTYTQIQAKLDTFPGLHYDYMHFLTAFTVVVSFCQVFVSLSFIAFFMNLLELRLLGYRHCFTMRRVYPAGSEGIGAWSPVMEAVGRMAVIINCGLFIFLMKPVRDYSSASKLAIFLISEHSLMFVKLIIEAGIDDQPRDVRRIEAANIEAITMMMGDIDETLRPVEILDQFLHDRVQIGVETGRRKKEPREATS